jgi:hypothetical protein
VSTYFDNLQCAGQCAHSALALAQTPEPERVDQRTAGADDLEILERLGVRVRSEALEQQARVTSLADVKECKSDHGLTVKRSTKNDVATVRVGDIVAQCPECGETRFRRRMRAGNGGEKADTIYTCLSCNAKVSRLDLVNQIGDEATRRARAAFDSLRKKPRRRR